MEDIRSKADVIRFTDWCIRNVGAGFHPDEDFADYVVVGGDRDSQPTFTAEEAGRLNALREQCFAVSGDDFYELGLACLQKGRPELGYLFRDFQDPEVQKQILADGTREEIIGWLMWNDPNGIYNDDHSLAEDRKPLTLDEARRCMKQALSDE